MEVSRGALNQHVRSKGDALLGGMKHAKYGREDKIHVHSVHQRATPHCMEKISTGMACMTHNQAWISEHLPSYLPRGSQY